MDGLGGQIKEVVAFYTSRWLKCQPVETLRESTMQMVDDLLVVPLSCKPKALERTIHIHLVRTTHLQLTKFCEDEEEAKAMCFWQGGLETLHP